MKLNWRYGIGFMAAALWPMACATATRTFSGDSGGGDGGASSSTSSSSGFSAAASSSGSTSSGNAVCGDGMLGGVETCDPPDTCPTSCDDGDACTTDALSGSAQACTAVCSHTAILACVADGCCPAGCQFSGDPDCAVCGNGTVESGEECDDQNMDDTDACLSNCIAAKCGDGVVWAGMEACDDGNAVDGDGCSSVCTLEGLGYGPVHTFEGMSSTFYMTQFGCSNSGGDPAGDALYFCQHFYNATCVAEPGFTQVMNSVNPMMHSGTNCYSPDPTGVSIANTNCVGGPCKIGTYNGTFGGLTNIVCTCN